LPDNFGNGFSNFFPLYLREHGAKRSDAVRANVSKSVLTFLEARGSKHDTLFDHIIAILHSPAYRSENAGALRMDWPHIPVRADAKGLAASAVLGAKAAALMDPDKAVDGITRGKLKAGFRSLGLPYKTNGKPLDHSDLSVSAGWGHVQTSKTGSTLVMPGLGMTKERDYSAAELNALTEEGKALGISSEAVLDMLGKRTFDVYLNANAMWSNVPEKVWAYTLAGYQVIKKWLSYREVSILGRALKPDEVAYGSEMVRRIAGILLLGPALDANYDATKADAVEWKEGRPAI
jgi:hypothetical protein